MRKDWVETQLGKVGQVVSGGTPKTSIREYWGGEIAWVTPADLSGYEQKYISKGRQSITQEGLENSSARLLPQNSILFSSRAPIGYVAIAGDELSTNQGFKSLVPSKALTSEFVYYYLKSIKQLAEQNANGTTFKELSGKAFSLLPIRIPPLLEQRAIVSKTEQLFSELDKGIANLKTAQEQLKVYRQAVLKKAFEGELTKKWREQGECSETGFDLLKAIKLDFKEKEKNKLKSKEKLLSPLEDNDIPFNVPKEWIWCKLGQIAWFINGDRGKNYPNKNEYVSKGVPWINTGHINSDGSLSCERMNYITREKFESLRSGKIQGGDLVYCLRGATFGKTAYVHPFTEGAIASSLMIIRTNDMVSTIFLYRYLTSVICREQLLRFDNGSAQPNLSANMVRHYVFPLPPLREQHQIVEEIESRLSVCDKVEESIKEGLMKAEALRQSILKKAFEGKLLSEQELEACRKEPDWEPAEKLLERIREEKATGIKSAVS